MFVSRKEEAADLLAKAVDGHVSEEEVVEVADDGENSSDDNEGGFGFKKAEAPPPKKRRTGKQPDADASAPSGALAPSAAPAAPKAAGKRKNPDSEVASCLSNAASAMASLEVFTPLGVWLGQQKTRDVDKRLHSAYNAQAALEDYVSGNPKAAEAIEQLGEVSRVVTEWMDVLIPFMSLDSSIMHIKEMEECQIDKFVRALPADCRFALLTDVGKRIWEEMG